MKSDFGKLKRKILWRVIWITLLVGILYFVLRILVDDVFSGFFYSLFIAIMRRLSGSLEVAQSIYFYVFMQNKELWMGILFLAVMLLVVYFALGKFTRYFQQVEDGVDQLADDSKKEIVLTPELDFMEKKLNTVKSRLELRTRAAQEAEQRKNDLVVYLAHDIKTPLTSVIGYLSLLDEAPDMPAEQRAKYVNITLEKAYRLEDLINEFFDITRFNLQTIVLEKEKINLTYMLMQMTDEFYPILEPQGKKAEVRAAEGLTVLADPDKLARVFNNILKNAIAYSDPQTTIHITAERSDDRNVVVRFFNQGRKIPPEKLNHIFEKFYRLDSARSTNTGGAGLGLAIAKEIVAAHGGGIYAQSDDFQTVFTVVLPEQ